MVDYTLTKTGAQIDAIHTKVDGIEAGADVTDETNVSATASVIANTAKISYTDAAAVALNTAKISFDATSSAKLATIEENADVTDATNVAAAGGVLNTGNETIAGVKTFSSSPIVPAPTTDLQTATKKYVDDNAGGTPEGTAVLSTGETVGKVLQADGDNTCSWITLPGGGDALVANPLSQFASTTSLELAGVISDETGTGSLVFATSPTLVTPALGTPSALVGTNITGTAASLTAGAVTNGVYTTDNLSVMASTTSAQLAGVISNETGSGSLVFATSPTLVTPILGTPTSGTLTNCTGLPAAGLSDVTATAAELNILDGATLTVTELNYVDGVTSAIQTQIDQQKEVIQVAVSDETTALTTGTAKLTFRMPYAMTLTDVRASVGTAPTGATIIVDINDSGTTIMTTNKLSIDATEKTSTTAATAPGITDTALADDAEITIDIDQVGSTIAGAGLKVTLIGTRA